jgi:hypothetical protein
MSRRRRPHGARQRDQKPTAQLKGPSQSEAAADSLSLHSSNSIPAERDSRPPLCASHRGSRAKHSRIPERISQARTEQSTIRLAGRAISGSGFDLSGRDRLD